MQVGPVCVSQPCKVVTVGEKQRDKSGQADTFAPHPSGIVYTLNIPKNLA